MFEELIIVVNFVLWNLTSSIRTMGLKDTKQLHTPHNKMEFEMDEQNVDGEG